MRPLGADREEREQRDRRQRDRRCGGRQLEREMAMERDAEHGFLQREHPLTGRPVHPPFELVDPASAEGPVHPSLWEMRTQERSVETTDTMSAPRNAGTKPSTRKSMPRPRPIQAANMSMTAFRTSVNKPSVSSMIGQLTSFRKGRTKAFTTPNTSARARTEPIPPAWMPDTNEAATQRAAALMRTRRMILMSRTSAPDSSLRTVSRTGPERRSR